RKWHFPQAMVDALEHQYAPFDNNVYEPLAGVIHLAAWRVRAKEARMSSRQLAVSFPGPVGVVLGLDIDMVLQQDPIDWSVQTPGRALVV
ncbi:MAG TPA: histidine kinase, partial [Burkholderiaceae bacterium]|nr:histidine kinase [Burkholderiaceae bacterium]